MARVVVVAAGLLLALAFPGGNFWPLAWVSLALLMAAVRGRTAWAAGRLGWWCGFAFFSAVLYWLPATVSTFTRIDPKVAGFLLVLMAAANAWTYAAFAGLLEAFAARGLSRLLVAPVLWTVLEWCRTFVVAGFPWASLGYSQYRHVAFLQIADLGGVYMLSAVLITANAAWAELWAGRFHLYSKDRADEARQSSSRLWPSALLVAGLPLLLQVYGQARIDAVDSAEVTGSVTVGLIQGNIAQDQKWDTALQDSILQRYLKLSAEAVGRGAELVVWPEASVPFYLARDSRSEKLAAFAAEHDAYLLVGSPGIDRVDGQVKPFNQAWMITPAGDFVGPYNKIQLVPFGEYIPFSWILGHIDVATESIGEFGRGEEYSVFEGPIVRSVGTGSRAGRPARVAPLICYEGIFPELTREFARRDPDLDVLANISNDAWYGDTAAPYQHLAMASLRSIENRLPMVRATNTGVSAFVEASGRVGGLTPLFEEDVAVQTVLLRDIPSFYRNYGNVWVGLCWLAFVGFLKTALLMKRPESQR
jgi:apolipoprotein N-acyltransferase